MRENLSFVYVEDEAMSRTVMNMLLLRGLGYKHLNIFPDSKDFLSRVEALHPPPHVFFLDIHVKPLDGFQMLELLRNHPQYQDSIVIALTASVMSEEVELLKTAGFNGGFAKPIDQAIFPEILERILAGEEVWYIA